MFKCLLMYLSVCVWRRESRVLAAGVQTHVSWGLVSVIIKKEASLGLLLTLTTVLIWK